MYNIKDDEEQFQINYNKEEVGDVPYSISDPNFKNIGGCIQDTEYEIDSEIYDKKEETNK